MTPHALVQEDQESEEEEEDIGRYDPEEDILVS